MARAVWTKEKLKRRFKEQAYRREPIDWGWYARKFAEARARDRRKRKRKR